MIGIFVFFVTRHAGDWSVYSWSERVVVDVVGTVTAWERVKAVRTTDQHGVNPAITLKSCKICCIAHMVTRITAQRHARRDPPQPHGSPRLPDQDHARFPVCRNMAGVARSHHAALTSQRTSAMPVCNDAAAPPASTLHATCPSCAMAMRDIMRARSERDLTAPVAHRPPGLAARNVRPAIVPPLTGVGKGRAPSTIDEALPASASPAAA